MKLKNIVALAGLMAGLSQGVLAQSAWRSVAVPYYTPQSFVQGLQLGWYAPRSREFAQSAERLTQATSAYCASNAGNASATAPREAWQAALLAWDRLGTVAVGPLVERRSARRIDFPTRPELLARAIEGQPGGEAEMERVGSAAKGLPALERLLWPKPAAPGSAACAYAGQVAADIGRESQALAEAFDAASRAELDDEPTVAAMSEAVNQWLGGLDALRLQGLEKPLHEQKTRGTARLQFGRDASGASAAERGARWQALNALAVFEGNEAPAPGAGLVPLEPYLRGKGLNPLADRLAAAVRKAGLGIEAARGNEPARVQAAARQLAGLKAFVETDIAPALDIRLGFSDADGD